ncbi:MAG: DUF4342 domain-containing protein [Bacillota bacterium]|nr:DUF4342 domain-containing protein [Bacillota bacterium]
MATLDQVEKLRERANVGYDEARSALDATNGDILEALIYLEKQGKVTPPAGGGYYSSEGKTESDKGPEQKSEKKCESGGESFKDALKRFGRFFGKLIHKGNVNNFEVLKGQESRISIPVTVLALLLLFAFWITVPLLVIGLFFGFRYHFQGPDLGIKPVNNAMDSAASAAESIKNSINNEKK